MCGAGGNLELGLKSRCPQSLEHALPCGGGGFRCSAHPAEPSELRFSELGFIVPGIMDVDGWLIGGRLVGWLVVGCSSLVGYYWLSVWLVGW